MSKLTKDYLVPISTLLINGALAYFINQLPSSAIIPSFLLIPKWWQNILLFLSFGIGVYLTFHYLKVDNSNAVFISFIFTLISIILLTGRDFLVKIIKEVARFWGDLQNRQAVDELEVQPFNREQIT